MAGNAQSLGVAALLGVLAVAAAERRRPRRERGLVTLADRALAARPAPVVQSASRQINWAAALLALAALTDSGVEHYRGSFHNKTMFVPLGVSALALAASLRDACGPPTPQRRESDAVDALALATGVIGTGFHFYNIAKRPGGFSWLNLFYAAPLGAPAALSLSGLLRRAATWVKGGAAIFGVLPGKLLAWLVSIGLLGTSAEAGLLHFRGAYHNPAMVIPITAPPIAAGLLMQAAAMPGQQHPITRWALRLLAGIGMLGAAFHAYGIQRNMGGWRNWSQNLLSGPPLPAPPSFTALAIAGLAALSLVERRR
ncbi:MAG TPA: hypothetical protein VGL83_02445 [Stellaceae bacterium]|jgi:hypothetical protein